MLEKLCLVMSFITESEDGWELSPLKNEKRGEGTSSPSGRFSVRSAKRLAVYKSIRKTLSPLNYICDE